MAKRKGIVVLFALLMVFLAACSGGNTSSNPGTDTQSDTSSDTETNKSDDQSGASVELRVAWWGGQARHDMMNALFDKFEEKYPHITVVREFGTENQFVEKVTTQAAGGNAPDVVQTSSFFLNDFVARNIHMELDALVDSGDIDLSDFIVHDVDGGKVDGKLYMISLGHNITGIIHNTEMFNKAGVPLPQNGWTWDEYIQTLKDLMSTF
jgi:ABC-type sugar transport system, periplasmic component